MNPAVTIKCTLNLVGSIPVTIIPSCQYLHNRASYVDENEKSRVIKLTNTSGAVLRLQYTQWPSYKPLPFVPTGADALYWKGVGGLSNC